MRRFTAIFLLASLILMSARLAAAQQSITGVYVTTQDFSSLRAGPGRDFERLTVIPPDTTLPATGRTPDSSWIQVEYEGLRGWIASWLLVWSGDMLALPLDGIQPERFARRSGPRVTVTQEMVIYSQQFGGPGERVLFPTTSAEVEVTGRLGSGKDYLLQFWYDGQYYWAGAWNFHLGGTGVSFKSVPDAAYVYPYGRLLGQIYTSLDSGRAALSTIGSIWNSLAAGQSFSCNDVPEKARVITFEDADLQRESIFVPAARAVETAIASTNEAITLLENACAATGTDRFLTTETVTTALEDISTARLNFTLAETLLPPLANRDPLLSETEDTQGN